MRSKLGSSSTSAAWLRTGASLIEHLQDAGYYRLSGYWHIFKQPDDTFREGTAFAKVWDLYTFDRQFRLVVFDAIERAEVYFRTQFAYELARTTGPFGFNDRNNLPNLGEERYERFIRKCKEAFNWSREPFAIHFKDKYGDKHELPPYWMLVNLMDFGMTLTLYKGASNGIRKRIVQGVGVAAPGEMRGREALGCGPTSMTQRAVAPMAGAATEILLYAGLAFRCLRCSVRTLPRISSAKQGETTPGQNSPTR